MPKDSVQKGEVLLGILRRTGISMALTKDRYKTVSLPDARLRREKRMSREIRVVFEEVKKAS